MSFVKPPPAAPRSSRRLGSLAAVCAVVLLSAQISSAQVFIRGEANGDGSLSIADVIYTMQYQYEGGPIPQSACGSNFTFDQVDANDNEYLTIADPLAALNFLFNSVPLPAPFPECGFDPGNSTQGFDTVDPEYHVFLYGPFDETNLDDPSARRVGFELGVEVPGHTSAIEFYFQYDPSQLTNPTYQGAFGLGVAEAGFGVIRVTLADVFTPLEAGPGLNRLGRIVFDVAPGVGTPDIAWLSTFSDTFLRRATVVDTTFVDHHPGFTRVNAPVFQRGDVNGDSAFGINDLVAWIDWFAIDASLIPISGCDGLPSEAGDVNDNEFITVADYTLMADNFFCGPGGFSIPAPLHCGVDPTGGTQGFEAVDDEFWLRATGFTLIGAGPIERSVEIPLQVLSPDPIRAVQFVLDLGPSALTLDTPFFETAEPIGSLVTAFNRQEGSLLYVTLVSDCDPILSTVSGGWQDLGALRLHLLGTELAGPIRMLPEAQVGDRIYRTSVVTFDHTDHHPVLVAGVNTFRRGDSNQQLTGNPVDYADPIHLLSYLGGIGPFPQCLDAADANDDGKIDYADPIYMLGYLGGMLPPFPSPFPECGFDTDIDELDCQFSACP